MLKKYTAMFKEEINNTKIIITDNKKSLQKPKSIIIIRYINGDRTKDKSLVEVKKIDSNRFKFFIKLNKKNNSNRLKNVRKGLKKIFTKIRKEEIDTVILNSSSFYLHDKKINKFAKIVAEEILGYLKTSSSLSKIFIYTDSEKELHIFENYFSRHISYIKKKTYRNPIPTVDIIIKIDNSIVLIERKNPPFGWALPGGFIEYGESLEEAAKREAKEETGLEVKNLRQFYTFSEPERDPRYHTISTVFIAQGIGKPKAHTDAKNLKLFKLNELPEKMAFDHKKILTEYLKNKKRVRSNNEKI